MVKPEFKNLFWKRIAKYIFEIQEEKPPKLNHILCLHNEIGQVSYKIWCTVVVQCFWNCFGLFVPLFLTACVGTEAYAVAMMGGSRDKHAELSSQLPGISEGGAELCE